MMEKEGFYVMTFVSTTDTIQTEKNAKERFRISLIPTPREITKSCGFAIRFEEEGSEERRIKEYFDGLKVPSFLYFMGRRNQEGKRPVTLIASRQN